MKEIRAQKSEFVTHLRAFLFAADAGFRRNARGACDGLSHAADAGLDTKNTKKIFTYSNNSLLNHRGPGLTPFSGDAFFLPSDELPIGEIIRHKICAHFARISSKRRQKCHKFYMLIPDATSATFFTNSPNTQDICPGSVEKIRQCRIEKMILDNGPRLVLTTGAASSM